MTIIEFHSPAVNLPQLLERVYNSGCWTLCGAALELLDFDIFEHSFFLRVGGFCSVLPFVLLIKGCVLALQSALVPAFGSSQNHIRNKNLFFSPLVGLFIYYLL